MQADCQEPGSALDSGTLRSVIEYGLPLSLLTLIDTCVLSIVNCVLLYVCVLLYGVTAFCQLPNERMC